jgi:hypothetical protein
MSRKVGLRAAALAIASTAVLAPAGALATGGADPSLLSPNHKHVGWGHIRLLVRVPLPAASKGVFIAINTRRRRDKYGHLTFCPSSRCDFVQPKHWKGDRYRYVAPWEFSGYWAVTPGKYYWQAHYYTAGDTAVYYSVIGSFYVK